MAMTREGFTDSERPAHLVSTRVRFSDLDGLGHLNNAVFHHFLEEARCSFFEENDLSDMVGGPKSLPIILARTEIDFLSQVNFGEKVACRMQVAQVGTKSFDTVYDLFDSEKTLVARARAVCVWFDHELQKSVPVPKSVIPILNKISFEN